MNTEEKDKIELIFQETKRIRILFGISIIILALILGFIAPVIIKSGLTFGNVEDSWGVGDGPRADYRHMPATYTASSTMDRKMATTTPSAQ